MEGYLGSPQLFFFLLTLNHFQVLFVLTNFHFSPCVSLECKKDEEDIHEEIGYYQYDSEPADDIAQVTVAVVSVEEEGVSEQNDKYFVNQLLGIHLVLFERPKLGCVKQGERS